MSDHKLALRSVLNGEYLRDLLSEQYSLGQWEECQFLLRGLNDTYKIKTKSSSYVLRVYRTEVIEDNIDYEVALIKALSTNIQDANTKVALPIEKKDRGVYTTIDAPEGKRVAVLFEYAKGIENQLNDKDSCYLFGQSAARLHSAMDKVNIQLPKKDLDIDFLIHQPLNRILNYIGESHQHSSFLKEFAYQLATKIQHLSEKGLDWGICHGDMHGNNNVQFHDGCFTHIDFEWAAKGWRAYDLAQVIISRRLNHNSEKAKELWNEIINGYQSVRSLSERDVRAVEDFAIARRFWVMNLDVEFINSDSGLLDYGDDWLNGFIEEFKEYERNN